MSALLRVPLQLGDLATMPLLYGLQNVILGLTHPSDREHYCPSLARARVVMEKLSKTLRRSWLLSFLGDTH